MKYKVLAAIALLAVATTAGCGDEVACPTIYRVETIVLQVQDSSDQAINDFSGTVTVSGEEFVVDCPKESGNPETDGYLCTDGLLIINATPVDTISADLETADDPPLVFSGDIDLDVQTSYPDGEECGAYREAETTVTLEPASS